MIHLGDGDEEQEARIVQRYMKPSFLGSSCCSGSSRAAFSVVSLISVVGLCVSLGGCKSQPKRPRAADTHEPVNTALSNIGGDSGIALPQDDELMTRDDGFGSVQDQIQESARQLSVYFANMEIDGVKPVDPDSRERVLSPSDQARADQAARAQGTQDPSESEPTETFVRNAPDEPSANRDEVGGGVRVSLLSGGGNEQEIGEPIEQPDPDKVAGSATDSIPESAIVEDALRVGLASDQDGDVLDSEVGSGVDAPVEKDPQVRKQELASELASILATLASTSEDPGSAALALASLETLLPSDSDALIDQGVLSDAEQASLNAVRLFLSSISSEGSIASPAQVASQLEEIHKQLNAWAGMTIKKAALCTQVDGFGRYETFSSYRFVAGVAQPAIVYVELERFAQRELTGPDGQPRYETKLSQRLELYHVADDLNTWNRSAETVVDETRNLLRDYYLINQITLPANLGVGRYHLKVVMRDLIGERSAETIIPIEIVAR